MRMRHSPSLLNKVANAVDQTAELAGSRVVAGFGPELFVLMF